MVTLMNAGIGIVLNNVLLWILARQLYDALSSNQLAQGPKWDDGILSHLGYEGLGCI